ncbi:M20 metallopeptidase family protein [Nocardioides sp. J54]|uniref:M20 metallopeptidase family protein n=1 Tax=Nocardioides sp. J54 TaxID=935866 RepID=UPI0004B47201|nr:M20 family metallopeptidase [Nocardioides sp. J54]
MADIWDVLESHLAEAAELRRTLHRQPELSGNEALTRDLVLAALPATSTPTKVAETGAVLRIGGAGRCVGMRGEMDALPVSESTGVDWASQNPGVMHACGHDVHLAALVAVARTIHEVGSDVPLLVVLQPREETYPSGARDIAEDGILDREQCAVMIGAHIQPALPAGVVACVAGGVNASSDEFEIEVRGEAGHAAYPHLADDPLLALAETVVALQSVVSRSIDPMRSAVVGVSSFQAGQAANVVPDVARATGTIRALASETRDLIHKRIVSVAENIARAHDCEAFVRITVGEPVLENDPTLVEVVTAELTAQDTPVSTDLRSLGADDFSYFSERVPATMMFVGTESDESLHTASLLPTDADLRAVARAMLAGYLGGAAMIRAGSA